MTAPEVRAGAEFRVAGRTLTGRVMTYGDISPEHRERFLPGAFGPAPSAPLNIQHDRNMVVLGAGDYALTDTDRALEIRAELPAGTIPPKSRLPVPQRASLLLPHGLPGPRLLLRRQGVLQLPEARATGVGKWLELRRHSPLAPDRAASPDGARARFARCGARGTAFR